MVRKLIIVLIAACLTNISNAQETVFAEVEGLESGRGIIKTRGNECFVIIPNHLIKDYYGTVNIYGEGSVLAEGEFVKSYTSDLAILRLPNNNNLLCSDWKLDREFDKVMEVVTDCKLEMRDKTGGISTMAVTVTGIDDQFIYVKPDNFREKIGKGMSGSSLFTEYKGKKVYLGMLQTVDMNTGEVLLADQIDNTLNDFFNPRKKVVYGSGNEKVSMGIVRETGAIRFELTDIERIGSNVNLKFQITSLDEDKEIIAGYSNIQLFDENGLKSQPHNIVIGNKSSHSVQYNLIHGISVPMEIAFDDISSSAESISLFTFEFHEDRTKRTFEIRGLDLPGATSYGSQYDGSEIDGISHIAGFKFQLMHVSKNGQEVICKFKVTSEERDKSIFINYSNVLLYDDNGFENNPKEITIGNKTSHSVSYNLIHGIEVPLDLVFDKVSSSAESIALLKIEFKSDNIKSEVQHRNIPLVGFNSGESNFSEGNCSEIYFYRMTGFLQCDDPVIIKNHDEEILRLDPGTRYKTVICDNRELKFTAGIANGELGFASNKPIIELGKNYYFKIGCSISVSKITEQPEAVGKKEIKKKGKYKRDTESFQLNSW